MTERVELDARAAEAALDELRLHRRALLTLYVLLGASANTLTVLLLVL